MRNSDYIVFDLETGGLEKELHPILEVAFFIVDKDNFKIKEKLEFLIKPYGEKVITKEALKINGLSVSLLENEGISAKEAFTKIRDFLKKANNGKTKFTRPILVGHNVVFDIEFLEEFFMEFKDSIYKYVTKQFICTQLEMKKLEKLTELNLKTCCEHFGIELVNAHRAGADVGATVELLKSIIMQFRNSSGKSKDKKDKKEKSRTKFQFG